MAVEARRLCLFPPQILGNREMVNGIEGNGIIYGGPMGYGLVSGTTPPTDTLIPPMYVTTMADTIPVKTAMKSDSCLTYSIPVVSRKRSRDAAAGITNLPLMSFPANQQNNTISTTNRCGSVTFLGEDISFPIHQIQLEIDQVVAQHTAKVRREIEERRKSDSRRIVTAMEESIMKKLRAKEEEIENIGKLNWALEERVKSLCVENQIWRELAQSNEATANALRNNLEQVLQAQAHAQEHQKGSGDAVAALMDDAQSCCGSNLVIEEEVEEVERRTMADNQIIIGDVDIDGRAMANAGGTIKVSKNSNNGNSSRLCRNCGKEEASVLLLPCRHLCLCSVCGPALHSCPICLSTKNATLHINLSSSSSSSSSSFPS